MLATSGPESCNTVNMLRLTETLFTGSTDPRLADYYERALYNHVLPVHDPKHGMCSYFTSMRPGHYRTYSSEFESFWCCLGTGIQAASRYGSFIYGKADDRFYINLFIPSEVNWEEMNATVRQETSFPDRSSTALIISLKEPCRFSLLLRHPWWIKSSFLNVRVNGEIHKLESHPSTYAELNRTWKDGDRVEVELPMELNLEALRSSDQYAAILFGPILLAGELGDKGLAADEFYQKMDHFAVHSIPVSGTPALSGSNEQILSGLKRATSEALAFSLVCSDRESPVSLIPFYRLHFQRYAVYWRIFPGEDARLAYRKSLQRLHLAIERSRSLALDSVLVGEDESEIAHGLESVDSATGVQDERSWRQATKGGWLSYRIQVDAEKENVLWVEYHGAELEENDFAILIDGRRIGTEKNLNNFDLPVIYGRAYRIPSAFVAGKTYCTVKFQAGWPSATPRIFAIRTMTQASLSQLS